MTWAAFFMNADGRIYGRFGGRDPSGPDSRNTLEGLHYAMEKALAAHAEPEAGIAPKVASSPLHIEKMKSARAVAGNGCIHCHQVKEILREEAIRAGTWDRSKLWTYPLPENLGLTLERFRGDHVEAVKPDSPASRIGLRKGDVLTSLAGFPVASFADAQYALHKAPWQGAIDVAWKRDKESMRASLSLADGWKRTNLTWRPSLLDLLPSLPLYGDDLTVAEKLALGLANNQLAFRQGKRVHSKAQAWGVQPGDVIVGLDQLMTDLDVDGFLAYVRRNHLVGDRVVLHVVRNGKRVELPLTLR